MSDMLRLVVALITTQLEKEELNRCPA